MLKIYHFRGTRSVRVIWLCEELNLPYEVESIDFSPAFRSSNEWRAKSPTGKVPVLEDNGVTMFESGAMVQYILESYGPGDLLPPPGTKESALHHQWSWFAEATFARPLGDIVHHTSMKPPAERIPEVVVDARQRAGLCMDAVDACVADREYLLGSQFFAADVMMGYTLLLASNTGVLTDEHTSAQDYYRRLQSRRGFQIAVTA